MRPKCGGKSGNGFIFKKINENENIKMKKKFWEPFRCQNQLPNEIQQSESLCP